MTSDFRDVRVNTYLSSYEFIWVVISAFLSFYLCIRCLGLTFLDGLRQVSSHTNLDVDIDCVIRNKNEQMLMGFAATVQFMTNNYLETQTALHEIIWYCQQNYIKTYD